MFPLLRPFVVWMASLCLASAATLPDPASFPVQPDLPDPLQFLSGAPVKSPRDWNNRRRPELKQLFEHYMYGALPARPDRITFETTGTHRDFLNGLGTLRTVTIVCGRTDFGLVVERADA